MTLWQGGSTEMPLATSFSRSKSPAYIEGKLVRLRAPMSSDFKVWSELRGLSRQHLEPWEPTWASDELSREAYRRRLRRYQQAERDAIGYMHFIFKANDNAFAGGVQVSNIRQGIAQSAATIGYWIGEPYASQGLMTDAVATVVKHFFDRMGFHRLEAACLPNNAASRRVLTKCGFIAEGTARKYLRINGEWQDHLLFAVISGDPVPATRS